MGDDSGALEHIATSLQRIADQHSTPWMTIGTPIIVALLAAAFGYVAAQLTNRSLRKATEAIERKKRDYVFNLLEDEINLRWTRQIGAALVKACNTLQPDQLVKALSDDLEFSPQDLLIFKLIGTSLPDYYFIDNPQLMSSVVHGHMLICDLHDFLNNIRKSYDKNEVKKYPNYQKDLGELLEAIDERFSSILEAINEERAGPHAKEKPMGLLRSARKHWKAISTTAVIVSTLAGALFSFFQFIFPYYILPRISPGVLETTIDAKEVSRTQDYSVQAITIDIKNTGLNRLYVPATYYLIQAARIEKRKHDPSEFLTPTDSAAMKQALQMSPKLKSADDRFSMQALESNVYFVNEWQHAFVHTIVGQPLDMQESYIFSVENTQVIRLGRLTDRYFVIDPGESVTKQLLAVIPRGYDMFFVDVKSYTSPKDISDLAFAVAAENEPSKEIPIHPEPAMLYVLPIRDAAKLTDDLQSTRDAIRDSRDSGFLQTAVDKIGSTGSSYFYRDEFFIKR